jgi:Spy/CpxP family protein refolding chaperone
MKKLTVAGLLMVLGLMLTTVADSAPAQRRADQIDAVQRRRGKANRRLNRPLGDRNLGPGEGRLPSLGQNQRKRFQQQLMEAIGLRPEQRQRMLEIRRNHEDELISAGRRLRQARQSLNRTIMSEQYDEQLIRQRAEDLASAQADLIRLQARIRAQVRSVLTTDQVLRFNELERRLRRQMREQREPDGQKQLQEQGEAGEGELSGEDSLDLVSFLLAIR